MSEPPSDPDLPFSDAEDTRRIVLAIAKKQVRQEGAATVWRFLGGVGVTIALGLGAWGVTYAQQAAVDHQRVDRLETDTEAVRADLAAMRASLEEMSHALARIEGRLEREEP